MNLSLRLAFGLVFFSCSSSSPEPQIDSSISPPPPAIQNKEKPKQTTPAVQFFSNNTPAPLIHLEIADTPSKTSRGLMYRSHMPPDQGMLFVFEADVQQRFWMKNTLIPLDMIFINSDLDIIGIVKNAEPQTTTQRYVEGLSRYVVEVNGGFADKHSLDKNSKVTFLNVDQIQTR